MWFWKEDESRKKTKQKNCQTRRTRTVRKVSSHFNWKKIWLIFLYLKYILFHSNKYFITYHRLACGSVPHSGILNRLRTLHSCLLCLRDYSDPLSLSLWWLFIYLSLSRIMSPRLQLWDYVCLISVAGCLLQANPAAGFPSWYGVILCANSISGIRTQKVEIVWIKIWNVVCALVADNVKITARVDTVIDRKCNGHAVYNITLKRLISDWGALYPAYEARLVAKLYQDCAIGCRDIQNGWKSFRQITYRWQIDKKNK